MNSDIIGAILVTNQGETQIKSGVIVTTKFEHIYKGDVHNLSGELVVSSWLY